MLFLNYDSVGERQWKAIDKEHVNVTQIWSGKMLITVALAHSVGDSPGLWCFTAQQVKCHPLVIMRSMNFRFIESRARRHGGKSLEEKGDALSLLQSQGPRAQNSAAQVMVDYAKERNLSCCWVCQNMPESTHDSMRMFPVPFSVAEYQVVDWGGLASRVVDRENNCFSPAFQTVFLEFLHSVFGL